MNTGICKGLFFGLACALSGCSDVEGLGFLQGGIGGSPTNKAAPVRQVEMGQGAVTLIAPPGFCVDPKNATQSFAIMARCDVLGGRNRTSDAPLALITMTLAQSDASMPLTSKALSNLINDAKILSEDRLNGLVYVRVQSDSPSDALSDVHWHVVDQINGFDVALALYAPDDSPALGATGPRILQRLLDGTLDASVAEDVAISALRPKAKPKKL